MSLKETLEKNKKDAGANGSGKIDLNQIEDAVDAAFPSKKIIIEPEQEEAQAKMKRPFIELSNEDYQKLKMVAAAKNTDIGKFLHKIVKTFLDAVELKV